MPGPWGVPGLGGAWSWRGVPGLGGGCLVWSWGGVCSWGGLVPGGSGPGGPGGTATAAGGTHPTRMHSCSIINPR